MNPPLDVIIQVGNGIKIGHGITIGTNGIKQNYFFCEEMTVTQFITEIGSGSNNLTEEQH